MSLRADFVLGGAHVEGHIQLLIQLYHSISYPNSLICAGGISGGTEDISARIFRMSLRADFVLGGAHVEGYIQLLIQLYHSISYPNSLIFAGDISGGRIWRYGRYTSQDI